MTAVVETTPQTRAATDAWTARYHARKAEVDAKIEAYEHAVLAPAEQRQARRRLAVERDNLGDVWKWIGVRHERARDVDQLGPVVNATRDRVDAYGRERARLERKFVEVAADYESTRRPHLRDERDALRDRINEIERAVNYITLGQDDERVRLSYTSMQALRSELARLGLDNGNRRPLLLLEERLRVARAALEVAERSLERVLGPLA